MGYDTPTRMAEQDCYTAASYFYPVYTGGKEGDMANLAMGLSQVANAIRHLSVGLRATYLKLDEIDKKLGGPR